MPDSVIKWRIENFSHWRAKVHGDHILSPELLPCFSMGLYPRGIGGQEEHLKVMLQLYGKIYSFSGELSFCSSDGSLLNSKQRVEKNIFGYVVPFPTGPKFEDVLSRIREGEDFITVIFRINEPYCGVRRVCTTINTLKISLEINPGLIEEMESDETRDFFYIQMSPKGRMWLKICSKNNRVHFRVEPPTDYVYSFAVEMNLTGSDGTVDSRVKKEHIFLDKIPWTFPDSLQKKELDGERISLFFCLTTPYLIHSPFYICCANSCVSIKSKSEICFPEKVPSTDPATSNKIEVLTKDSGSQTSLTSDMPDDSILVLSKDLMCLYQDQDFADISLKCDNVTFPVHKNILSTRSPVFKTMLSTDMAEAASSEVDIGDLDPSTLGLFLTQLYTGAVEEELQCDRALKLYYAADKYQVPSLKRDCSKFLFDNVSVSNVCDILSLADKHSDDQLMSVAQEFILNNYEVLKSNEWESFMCREPILAVKTLTIVSVRKHDSK